MKKGQATIFIILGLTALLAIGFMIYSIPTSPFSNKTGKMSSVDTFVQSCLDQVSRDAVLFVAYEGGYYTEPPYSDSAYDLPYYFYNEQNVMPSQQVLEKELETYITDALGICTADFEPYTQQGYSLEYGDIETNVLLAEESVIVDVTYPITVIHQGTVTSFSDFSTKVTTRLYTIYSFIQEYMEAQSLDSSTICISCITTLSINYDLKVQMIQEGSDVLFTIIDEQIPVVGQEVQFRFVNQYPLYSCDNLPSTEPEDMFIDCIQQAAQHVQEKEGYSGVLIEEIQDQTISVGEQFFYTVKATGLNVTYSDASSLFTIDPITGVIDYTPKEDDVGKHIIWIHTVDKVGFEDYEQFTLEVTS